MGRDKKIFAYAKKLHMYAGLLTFSAFLVWGITGVEAVFLPAAAMELITAHGLRGDRREIPQVIGQTSETPKCATIDKNDPQEFSRVL
jgi:hypothetical protein